jgi:ATP-dependent DNA helicase RecG
LLYNAFCHRNYFQESANISVAIFADKVVVSLGGLPSGLHRETFGHKSVRLNHVIVDLFARTRYLEKAGNGIGLIRHDAEPELHHCKYDID